MAQAREGIGTYLKLCPAVSPYTPVTIPNSRDIQGPTLSTNTYDTTSQDSTSGHKEFIPGLHEAGSISTELYFDANDTFHQSLLTKRQNRELQYWEKHLANTSPKMKMRGLCYVTNLDFNEPVDGVQTASLELSLTGPVALEAVV